MSWSQGAPQAGPYGQSGGMAAAPRNGLGIAALVLGIIGALLFWTVIGGLVLGLLALIFGIIGYRRTRRGEATNGAMSIIGAILGTLAFIASGVILAAGISLFNSHDFKNLQDCVKHAHTQSAQQQCRNDYKHSVTGN